MLKLPREAGRGGHRRAEGLRESWRADFRCRVPAGKGQRASADEFAPARLSTSAARLRGSHLPLLFIRRLPVAHALSFMHANFEPAIQCSCLGANGYGNAPIPTPSTTVWEDADCAALNLPLLCWRGLCLLVLVSAIGADVRRSTARPVWSARSTTAQAFLKMRVCVSRCGPRPAQADHPPLAEVLRFARR